MIITDGCEIPVVVAQTQSASLLQSTSWCLNNAHPYPHTPAPVHTPLPLPTPCPQLPTHVHVASPPNATGPWSL